MLQLSYDRIAGSLLFFLHALLNTHTHTHTHTSGLLGFLGSQLADFSVKRGVFKATFIDDIYQTSQSKHVDTF